MILKNPLPNIEHIIVITNVTNATNAGQPRVEPKHDRTVLAIQWQTDWSRDQRNTKSKQKSFVRINRIFIENANRL